MMFKRSNLIISVIIPSFNRAAFLRNNLESLLNQTFPKDKFEIVVVDNMSADNSKEVFDEFEQRALACGLAARFISEKQKGLLFTRHTGAIAAKATLLAFIDDDCLCSEGWLDGVVKAFRDFDADAVGGKISIKWDQEPPHWIKKYEGCLGRLDRGPEARMIEGNESIYGGNFCIRRDRLLECGGFNPGQLGDYLTGDSEIGLVRKMQDRGWKIVWAPDALLWHCQTVAKNATEKDIGRRYYNNGIASAYANAKKNGVNKIHLITEIVRDCVGYLKMYLKNYVKFILNKEIEKPDFRRYKFDRALLKGRMKYNWRLIFDTKLKEFIKREDWINE